MTSGTAFALASAVEMTALGCYRATIPDGWEQGRGAFGGLVLGALLRAMERANDDPQRVPRVLTGDLCGPVVAGEVEIDVRTLRRGKNVSNLDAQLMQGGEVLARASAVLSTPRSVEAPRICPPSPVHGRSHDVPVAKMGRPGGPAFAEHYEYRVLEPFPFAGGTEPVTRGWVREVDAPPLLDAPALIGLLDAWWPALFSLERAPRPVATVSFTAELLVPADTLDASEPLFYCGRDVVLRDGYFVELRELWSGDQLVAMNQQTFALLR